MTDKPKLIHTFPAHEKIVSMIIHKDIVYVATEHTVYKIVSDELIPLKIVRETSDA